MERKFFASLIFIFVGLLFSSEVSAQELESYPSSLSVKNFTIPGLNELNSIAEVLQVSPKEVIIISKRKDSATDPDYKTALISMNLNSKGKISNIRMLHEYTGKIHSVRAIWPGKDSDHGLVFIFTQPENLLDMIGEPGYLKVARIDKTGKLLGKWKTLYEIQPEEFDFISIGDLSVAFSSDSVGVLLPWSFYRQSHWVWGIVKGHALFFETDFNGNRLPETLSLKLPNKGNYVFSRAFTPYHNGNRWLIPLNCEVGKSELNSGPGAKYSVKTIGQDVYIFTARRKKSLVFSSRANRIDFVRTANEDRAFGTMNLIGQGNAGTSSNPPASKGVPVTLMLQEAENISQYPKYPERYRIYYSLHSISVKGKTFGKSRPLNLERINFSLSAGGGYSTIYLQEVLFPFEPDNASANVAAASSDTYFFRVAGKMLKNAGTNYKIEFHLQLLQADLAGGSVKTLSSLKYSKPLFGFYWFGRFGKDLCAIATSVQNFSGNTGNIQHIIIRNK